jgi:hypothetical protein
LAFATFLALAIDERPNLIAPHALGMDVAHRPVVELFASLTSIRDQLGNCVDRHVTHPRDRLHGSPLAKLAEDLDTLRIIELLNASCLTDSEADGRRCFRYGLRLLSPVSKTFRSSSDSDGTAATNCLKEIQKLSVTMHIVSGLALRSRPSGI